MNNYKLLPIIKQNLAAWKLGLDKTKRKGSLGNIANIERFALDLVIMERHHNPESVKLG